ncbi:MAG: DUF4097 domain-containing protein [Caldisericia bacterium]|nr:DUF4097 domain-containing protein [Caldisericia bacterium]
MSDKEELIKRIEELFNQGKISEIVKNKLIEKVKESTKEEKIGKIFNNIILESISEDIEIIGKENLNEIVFEYGKEGFEIEEREGTLYIRSKLKNIGVSINIFGFSTRETLSEKIRIFVPTKTNALVNTVSGNVEIENINGNIKIKCVSGDIEIKNIDGDIDLYSISGDIIIESINGNFKLNSKSGDINAKNINKSGFIKTYSGDIDINKGHLEKFILSTFSGDVSIYNLTLEDSVEIKTISGDINLTTSTKDINVFIETKTGEGSIIYEGKITKLTRGEIGFGSKDKKINIKTLSGNYKIEVI